MSQVQFFWWVVFATLIAGIFGGLLNFLLYKQQLSDLESARPPAATSKTFVPLAGNIVLGIGAAFLVPLFLHVIGSDLLGKMSGTPGDGPQYSQLLVFGGFCLVASMSAKSFIQSVSERVVRKAENAEKLAGEAKREVSQAQAVLTRLIEPEGEVTPATMKSISEESLDASEACVLKALVKAPYVLRASTGISRLEGIEDTDGVLARLQARKLANTIFISGFDGADRPYWYISAQGLALLNKLETPKAGGS